MTATLAARAREPVQVVSGDRDLFALVRDPDVRVLYPLTGVSKLLELNLRQGATSYYARAAGGNIVECFVDDWIREVEPESTEPSPYVASWTTIDCTRHATRSCNATPRSARKAAPIIEKRDH